MNNKDNGGGDRENQWADGIVAQCSHTAEFVRGRSPGRKGKDPFGRWFRLFIVDGEPVAQPRPRRGANKRMYTPGSHPVKVWRDLIAIRYRQKNAGQPPIAGPVSLTLMYLLPGKSEENIRLPHIIKPDLDNLEKATLDALNGLAWNDDCQVWEVTKSKVICSTLDSPCLVVKLTGYDSVDDWRAGK